MTLFVAESDNFSSMKAPAARCDVARATARRIHADQVTRSGEPVIDHVQRVADAVPIDARALAYLHDVLERSETAAEELYELGLSDEEWSVLTLLTRRPRESYAAYVMRIARADGRRGRLARVIKAADLDDHLRRRTTGAQFPTYTWARARILAFQRAHGELDVSPEARMRIEPVSSSV